MPKRTVSFVALLAVLATVGVLACATPATPAPAVVSTPTPAPAAISTPTFAPYEYAGYTPVPTPTAPPVTPPLGVSPVSTVTKYICLNAMATAYAELDLKAGDIVVLSITSYPIPPGVRAGVDYPAKRFEYVRARAIMADAGEQTITFQAIGDGTYYFYVETHESGGATCMNGAWVTIEIYRK